MSTRIKYLSADGLRHFLEKLKSEVLSNYMPLNNYTFEYATNNETSNDIILHVNRANPQLFQWIVGYQDVNEPYMSNTGPIRAYSMVITDLSVFTQQNLVITMGGETKTYNPFTVTPTINDVFNRILTHLKQFNWSGYIHYAKFGSNYIPTLVFTFLGTDTNMDLDITPSQGLVVSNAGDKYYDVILHYNKIYNRYILGDQQSLRVSGLDLPIGFTQHAFDKKEGNDYLYLEENNNFGLIQWLNKFGNNLSVITYLRQTSIIHSDTDNKLIINNNLTPSDNNSISIGDSDNMFSYVHAIDFVERGVMLRDTYLNKASELTNADIDTLFT